MQVNLKAIVIDNKKKEPYFKLIQQMKKFKEDAVVMKVLSFSIDPVMRVWLAGAKTNFRTVGAGDIFNAFGVGVIVYSRDQNYLEGSYLFGNTGTVNYLELDEQRKKECFPIDSDLVEKLGPFKYLYLINNGLAAYQGFEILEVKPSETVVVSTAAGATGLLLCHLLKKRGAKIVALCSPNKTKYLQPYTSHAINYKDRALLTAELSKLKFSKYFDNVGESQLDLVLSTIQKHGTIAMCGAIQHYLAPKEGGISNLFDLILKRIKLEGINFATLIGRVDQIFKEYEDAELLLHVEKMQQFLALFLELFKSGGSVIGKVVIDPHL